MKHHASAQFPKARSAIKTGVVPVLAAGFLAVLAGCVVQEEPGTTYYPPAPTGGVVYGDASGGVAITVESDFYEPLQPYGEWVEVDGYGRCWRPHNVASDWRPYSHGRWLRTESGWYWQSDESWGWATSHYGRWNQDSRVGWYWVPGTEWAPAWVSWREGGGYTGWAPLPPRPRVGVSVEIDLEREPQRYVYVEERHFSEPVRPSTVIVNNTTVINKTVNITNTHVTNNTVINNTTVVNNNTVNNHNNTFVNAGPRPEVIAQATGRVMPVTRVQDVRRHDEAKAAVQPRSAPPGPSAQKPASPPPAPTAAAKPATPTPSPSSAPAPAPKKKVKKKAPPPVEAKPVEQKPQ